jgi:hypothetical protein
MEMVMNLRVQDRSLLAFRRRPPGLAIISFLFAALASPVSAQTSSDSSIQWIGSTRAHGQLELNGSLISPSLAVSSDVTPTVNTKNAARRVESKVRATQPKFNLGTKSWLLRARQDRQNQSDNDGFLGRGRKIPVAGLNR